MASQVSVWLSELSSNSSESTDENSDSFTDDGYESKGASITSKERHDSQQGEKMRAGSSPHSSSKKRRYDPEDSESKDSKNKDETIFNKRPRYGSEKSENKSESQSDDSTSSNKTECDSDENDQTNKSGDRKDCRSSSLNSDDKGK